MSLSAYFEKHSVYQDSNYYSHVSMELSKKYLFEHDSLEEMWETYCKGIMAGEPAYYQERMLECCTLRGDFDLKIKKEDAKKYKISSAANFYTEEDVQYLVKMFFAAIQKTLLNVKPEQLVCFVLEKSAPTETDTHIKCGFHLEFPFILLSKEDLSVIVYPKLVSLYEEYDVFMRFGDYSKGFFDSHILSNAWLMYGSKKSASATPYKVSTIYDSHLNPMTLEKVMENRKLLDTNEQELKLDQPLEFYLPRILSTLYLGKKHYICRAKPQDLTLAKSTFKKLKEPEKNSTKIQPTTPEERVKEARELLPFLSETRADNYHMWMKIGWLLYNVGEGSQDALQLWIDFSKRTTKGNFSETKCIFEWGKMKLDPEGLTLGTLRYYANEDSPEEYSKYCRARSKNLILQSIEKSGVLTHTAAAQALWQHYKSHFVYTSSREWYAYAQHRWNLTVDGIELRKKIADLIAPIQEKIASIRTEIRDIDEKIRDQEEQQDEEDEAPKRFSDKDKQNLDKMRLLLIKEKNKLEETSFKDRVLKECRELFLDTEFESKLDANVNLVGFTNGVLDLKDGVFRDGRPDDYVCLNTKYDFRIVEEASKEMLDVDDYLLKVFPDTNIREYFLDQMCLLLRGGNLLKKVLLFADSRGNNSKSVAVELIQNTLGDYAIELPTTVLTDKAAKSSSATPEIMRTKGRRFVVVQEPGPETFINIGMLKLLSGNDKVSGRDLFKSQTEFRPMFKLAIICNRLPRVSTDDQAVWNRLRVVPFESRFIEPAECAITFEEQFKRKEFPVDPTFSTKLPGMKYAFMSKLFKRYLEAEKKGFPVWEPERVVCETKKYRSANDVFSGFLCDQLISDPESNGLMLNDLYETFRQWYRNSYSTNYVGPKHELKEYLTTRYSKFFIVNRLIGFRYRTEQDDEEILQAEFERIQRERMDIRLARQELSQSQGN
jgi:P4 family phage/plasmid primase-like protien